MLAPLRNLPIAIFLRSMTAVLFVPATVAHAGPLDSCTLTISIGGSLRLGTSGSILSSELSGASKAVLLVSAVGAKPNLLLSAPVLTNSPTGYNNAPQVMMKYASLAGANQPYTSAATSYTATSLIDTITIDARVIDTQGFKAGTYTVGTTVTCQQ
jgi:hypothetical protein